MLLSLNKIGQKSFGSSVAEDLFHSLDEKKNVWMWPRNPFVDYKGCGSSLDHLEDKKANIGLNPPQNEIKTVTIDQVNFLATLDDLRPKLRERLIKEGINELLPL